MGHTTVNNAVARMHAISSQKTTNVSELFKTFHLFVSSHNTEFAENVREILDEFHPLNDLETQFKFKIIYRYKVSSEVLKMLVSGDTYKIALALKCGWYFAELKNAAEFLSNISEFSLSTRIKIINKYAACLRNTKAGEELYVGLKNRYGTKAAISIMPACSENFIRNELPNVKMVLPPNITLSLFKKYPSLMAEYLKFLVSDRCPLKHRQSQTLEKYECVFLKLASFDLDAFTEIVENHGEKMPYMKLGRRPTKRLIKTCKKVLSMYSSHRRLFVQKTFFNNLPLKQVKELFISSLLPASVSEFVGLPNWAEVFKVLEFFKLPVQCDIIQTSFLSKYNRDLFSDEITFNMNDTCIRFLPKEHKIKCVEKKLLEIDSPITTAQYLALLPTDYSMPKLKKLIESQSETAKRAAIAKHMIRTLHINQCFAGISELFSYFVKRFRNENIKFREVIVSEMEKLDKLFLNMKVRDWVPVADFINIIKLNNEVKNFKGSIRMVFSLQLHCYHLAQADVESVLKNYLEFELAGQSGLDSYVVNISEGTPCQKFCLEWFLKEVPEVRNKEVGVQLLENVCKFNQQNVKDRIELPSWLVELIEETVTTPSPTWYYASRVLDSLRANGDSKLRDSIVQKCFPNFVSNDLVLYSLGKFPETVVSNIQAIMRNALSDANFKSYSSFYRKSRLYHGYNLSSEIIKICEIVLKIRQPECHLEENNPLVLETSQPQAVFALSVLLEQSKYLDFISKYVPTESKVTQYSEEVKAIFEIQKAVCKSFVNFPDPSPSLPVIRKFAFGDYLKLVVGSLLGVCMKISERDILPHLKEWIDCPVSLRKHFLRLIYEIAPADCKVEIFVDIFKTEKNASLRHVLFLKLYQAFIDEPDDDSYGTFKSVITHLTVEDEEPIKNLLEIQNISDTYLSQYLQLLWYHLGSDWGAVLPNGKTKIMELIDKHKFEILDEEFCDMLLDHVMKTSLPLSSPSSFLWKYLLYSPSQEIQTSRLTKVMAFLQPMIRNNWNQHKIGKGHVFPIRYIISDIISTLYSEACKHPVDCTQLAIEVKKSFSTLIKPEHFLKESISLDLILLHQQKNVAKGNFDFPSAVAELYHSYIQKQTPQFGFSLMQCLVECRPRGFEGELAYRLIKNYSNPYCHLTGIEILNSDLSQEADIPIYKEIIQILSASEHPDVKVAANVFFEKLHSSLI